MRPKRRKVIHGIEKKGIPEKQGEKVSEKSEVDEEEGRRGDSDERGGRGNKSVRVTRELDVVV